MAAPEHDRPLGGEPSFGNLSPRHWSQGSRADQNREALEYYRSRSRAPGVADGGEARNFYCMDCDGVIPFDFRGERCPHCQAELDENVKRYFNWVEINEPPASDARALAKLALPFVIGAVVVVVIAWLVLR